MGEAMAIARQAGTMVQSHLERRMGLMLTGSRLREAVAAGRLVSGGDPGGVEGVKYDFRLSPRVLKAKFGRPINANDLAESEKLDLQVEPGEVVFVLTEERLTLPNNVVALLSPKRKLSHAGILTLGGFCIDPGYSGYLLLGLFNLSSTAFPIIPGKKVIAATFYELHADETGDFPAPEAPVEDFPDELVALIAKYRPLATQSIVLAVEKLQGELTSLKNEIRNHEDWYKRFKESLETHNQQIGKLTAELSAESQVRKSGQDDLTTAVQSIKDTLTFLRGAAWIVMGALGIGLAVFLAWLIKMWVGA
jgi:deoxycytidine triphosphate deaminase